MLDELLCTTEYFFMSYTCLEGTANILLFLQPILLLLLVISSHFISWISNVGTSLRIAVVM